MSLRHTNACKRLSAIGLRQQQVHQIVDLVDHWIKSSGPEWTVARLKEYKQMYLHKLADQPYTPNGWIKTHPDGRPKGPLGCLWRFNTLREVTRALNVLNAYTTQVSPDVTAKQLHKFVDSVCNPTPSVEKAEVSIYDNYLQWKSKQNIYIATPKPEPLEHIVLSSSRRAPISALKTCPETDIVNWWGPSADNGTVRVATGRWPDVFHPSLKEAISVRTKKMPDWDSPRQVGKVSFIQEAGFKLRAVANPNRILQHALIPLQRQIWSILKDIPEDCTFDQDRGVAKVQEMMNLGVTCHSIDLSDATNNFPFSLQYKILQDLLSSDNTWSDHLKLFEFCSKEPWALRNLEGEMIHISWKKGQPLGLAPSFGSFALAHHMVAKKACIASGNKGNEYVLLGDDIVFFDDKAAQVYKTLLRGLGCPISESKTITSKNVAEFAGKVVTPMGVAVAHKWRDLSDRNFLDLVKVLGNQFIGALRPRQRKIAKAIAEIPEEFGGLGWNPKGKPYDHRISENWDKIKDLDVFKESEHPISRVNTYLTELKLELGLTTSFTVLDTLLGNQGPVSASTRQGPTKSSDLLRKQLVENLSVIDELWYTEQPLPDGYMPAVRGGDPRGRTTLDIYESKLERHLSPEMDESSDQVVTSPMKLG